MLKPQDVSTHVFNKALLRGYNMSMVDEFLDAVAEDYAALYQENATLKGKLKAMAEKVDEYRATEEAMRSALLAAQKTAESILKDAETRRDEILANASDEALSRRDDCRKEVAELEERMRRGRTEMARFIASGRELCSQELKFLEQLPQMQVNVTLSDYKEEKGAETPSESAKADEKAASKKDDKAPRLDELKFGQSLKKD
jgi:cell division initiation protein